MAGKFVDVNLDSLGNGAARELFQRELAAVIENVLDVNTKHTDKRKITMTFEIIGDEARESVSICIKCASKLAPVKPLVVTAHVAEDKNGETVLVQKCGKAGDNVVDMKEAVEV